MLAERGFNNRLNRFRMKNPSPGSCFAGFGRPGEGTVPIGAALTTTMRRTSVACITWTMARVPCQATPVSEFDRGPRPERIASAPSTADSSAAGSAAARSAATMRTCQPKLLARVENWTLWTWFREPLDVITFLSCLLSLYWLAREPTQSARTTSCVDEFEKLPG